MKAIVLFCLVLGLMTLVNGRPVSGTVFGTISIGESIPMDGLNFRLDDLEKGSHNAALSVVDGATGSTLAVEEVAAGGSVARTIAGTDYTIYVNKTAEGYELISKWATITVVSGAALINVGQSHDFGGVRVALDDLNSGTRDAIITISGRGLASQERILEGGYVIRNVSGTKYKITVVQTSAGYSFGAKWAKIKVEPAGYYPESPNYPATPQGGIIVNGTMRLQVDDIEWATRTVTVSVLDPLDNIISKDKIAPGMYIVRAADGGQKYKIQLMDAAPGYMFGAKWAKLTVQTTTLPESANYPVINQMETLINGSAQVTLDDLEAGTGNALVSIGDGVTVLAKERIPPGGYVIRTIGRERYKIQVYQTAMGYTFGSKWAKVTLMPTTLPETMSYAGSSVINQGERLVLPSGVKLQLDDIELGTRNAIVSIWDSNDNIVSLEKIAPSTSMGYVVRSINGTRYKFNVYETAPGYILGAKWARVSVQNTTLAETPLPGGAFIWSGIINRGEAIPCGGGSYRALLDDIELDSRDAIIRVTDADDVTLANDRIAEGQTRSYNVGGGSTCTVKIAKTAQGYTFGSVWAFVQTN